MSWRDDLYSDEERALSAEVKRLHNVIRELNQNQEMCENLQQVFFGDYVCTPIKNAYNNKTAYWISKKYCTISMYMFTVEHCSNKQDLQNLLSESNVQQHINMLEEKLNPAKY